MSHEVVNRWLASAYLVSGVVGWLFVDVACVAFILACWKLYKTLKGVP